MTDSIDRFLASADAAGPVLAHARLLLRLQAAYGELQSGHLAAASRVVNVKAGTVVIHADNGAVAAKLRQSAQTLREGFLARGFDCQAVVVKVQAPDLPPQAPPVEERPLSARSGAELHRFAETLPADSPLRAAIETLIARAKVAGD